MKFQWAALLLLKIERVKRRTFILSCNRKQFHLAGNRWEIYIWQCCIPHCSLLSVNRSPWHHVYDSRDDQAMITLTGIDVNSFNYLLGLFAPVFDKYSPFVDDEGYIVKN